MPSQFLPCPTILPFLIFMCVMSSIPPCFFDFSYRFPHLARGRWDISHISQSHLDHSQANKPWPTIQFWPVNRSMFFVCPTCSPSSRGQQPIASVFLCFLHSCHVLLSLIFFFCWRQAEKDDIIDHTETSLSAKHTHKNAPFAFVSYFSHISEIFHLISTHTR
jgi:hypothetical protein